MWNVLTYIVSVNPWCKWLSLNDVQHILAEHSYFFKTLYAT